MNSPFKSRRDRPNRWITLVLQVIVVLSAAGQNQTPAVKSGFTLLPQVIGVGANPSAIVARDLNEDGLPDLITADRGMLFDLREERPANDEISVLWAQSPWNYTREVPPLKTGFGPWAVCVANVDGLKWPDIIVANFHDARFRHVSVFLNRRPENLFVPKVFKIDLPGMIYQRQRDGDGQPLFASPGLTAVTVLDYDQNGLRDLAATAWSADALILIPGSREEIFGPPKLLPAPGAPRDLQAADMDGDGNIDLAVVYYATAEFSVWRGDGKGNFTEGNRIPTRGILPTAIRVADFNGDGLPDVAVSHCHATDNVVVFLGNREQPFSVSVDIALGKDRKVLEKEIRDITVADFNGDGKPDIAAACFTSKEIALLLNRTTSPEDIKFDVSRIPIEKGNPRALCAADLDGDGDTDMAAAVWSPDSVILLRNDLTAKNSSAKKP